MKFRIEEYKGNFYPQVEVEFIFKKNWFWLLENIPNSVIYVYARPAPTTNNESIETAEKLITIYKKSVDYKIKYHNEREETIG